MRRSNTIYDDLKGVSAIYLLRHSEAGAIARVGQTVDLNARQGGHWGRYPYFTFRRCPVRSLDRFECLAWHRYGGERGELDGNHPPRPAGGCPVASCRLNERS